MKRLVHILAVWLTLVSLLLSASGFAPAVVAMLAEWDGEHVVEVDAADGGLKVTLHHPARGGGWSHGHGILLQLGLAAVSATDDSANHDHLAQFAGIASGTETKQEAQKEAASVPGGSEINRYCSGANVSALTKHALLTERVFRFHEPPHLRSGAAVLLM